jgi:hypothetical protein
VQEPARPVQTPSILQRRDIYPEQTQPQISEQKVAAEPRPVMIEQKKAADPRPIAIEKVLEVPKVEFPRVELKKEPQSALNEIKLAMPEIKLPPVQAKPTLADSKLELLTLEFDADQLALLRNMPSFDDLRGIDKGVATSENDFVTRKMGEAISKPIEVTHPVQNSNSDLMTLNVGTSQAEP